MTDRELIELLYAKGALYATSDRPAGSVLAVATTLLPARKVFLAGWALQGQATGHEWCACGACGALRLVKPRAGTSCKMTPGCEGLMVRIAPRPFLSLGVKASLLQIGGNA
jgi:hypothetical protein